MLLRSEPEIDPVAVQGVRDFVQFLDRFAGELLMPSDGARRFAEETGLPPRLVDPVVIIRIQRYFGVSWPTALVRLRQMNAITQATFDNLRHSARPAAPLLANRARIRRVRRDDTRETENSRKED